MDVGWRLGGKTEATQVVPVTGDIVEQTRANAHLLPLFLNVEKDGCDRQKRHAANVK